MSDVAPIYSSSNFFHNLLPIIFNWINVVPLLFQKFSIPLINFFLGLPCFLLVPLLVSTISFSIGYSGFQFPTLRFNGLLSHLPYQLVFWNGTSILPFVIFFLIHQSYENFYLPLLEISLPCLSVSVFCYLLLPLFEQKVLPVM